MDKNAVLNAIERLRMALDVGGVHVERIVLFGSWAHGAGTVDSDIDLVVISADFEGKSFWERLEDLARAHAEVFEPFDLVAMTPEEWDNHHSSVVDYAANGEVVHG
jgi:uncharacterized protein